MKTKMEREKVLRSIRMSLKKAALQDSWGKIKILIFRSSKKTQIEIESEIWSI